ncbi:hypothetical protein ACIRBX_18510 [Kitasatospora sp. NPDC096147]|uniref:hypothetical protein n=1 Tax=Kitasatospora sp. NPDC096147 TaxID=3364093 RepID=UPI00381365EA
MHQPPGVENMIGLLLVGLLAFVAFGCVCILWADRGGPRWTHGVVTAMRVLAATAKVFGDSTRGRRRSDPPYVGGDGS